MKDSPCRTLRRTLLSGLLILILPLLGRAGLLPWGSLPNVYVFNVRSYGARGDGRSNDAAAINRAILAASRVGGGIVYVPAGTYLSGSIRLKSRITLELGPGSTLEAISDSSAYDRAEPNSWDAYQDYGHSHFHNAFIWGEDLQDVAITGSGRIYGKGLKRSIGRKPQGLRLADKAISLKNCRNVLLRDFSILKGGHFGLLATGVDNLTIDNLKIDTNRDGMDIDCCHNVRITACSVNSPWDDGICLKSSYALGYKRATSDVTISDCMVSGDYQMGSLLDGSFRLFDPKAHVSHTGRIKLGTESDGGFHNITITNCVFDRCQGLALETVDGGDLEDVSISNITMRRIYNMPIFLRLGSRLRGPKPLSPGKFCRVDISHITVYHSASRAASAIVGIPGYDIRGVRIRDVQLDLEGGGTRMQAQIRVPEKAGGYPEPTMFGTLPAYGFYLRHVQDIQISNFSIWLEHPDQRPCIAAQDVSQAKFRFGSWPEPRSGGFLQGSDLGSLSVFQVDSLRDASYPAASRLQL